jgi:beta-lactam-binding protein with PASTA domain
MNMRKPIFILIALALFACHKEELIDVPDVTNQPTFVAEAMRRVQASGFRTELRLQQNERIAPGFVIDEAPRTPQPRGATITLTVATRTPNSVDVPASDQQQLSDATAKNLERFFRTQIKVPVPSVAGLQAVPAIKQMQAFGFHVILAPSVSPFGASGVANGQIPPPNTEQPWGSDVTISVGATIAFDPQLSAEDAVHLSPATEQRLTATFAAMPPPQIFILGTNVHILTHT